MHYMDHAAATTLLDCAREAMMEALSNSGNPSSLHAPGRAARRSLEEAREQVAGALGVLPAEVILTAGGTEADNLAVKGLWWARTASDPQRRRVLASPIEHPAVRDAVRWLGDHEGAQVQWLSVDHQGRVDPAQVVDELRADPDGIALVAVMAANNEVGTRQPVEELAQVCTEVGVPLHVDAVQAVGSVPVDAAGPATLALSAHKFGGPRGVGALVVRRGLPLVPLTHGGGQERRLRSGTQDVAGAAGLAAALTHVIADLPVQATRLTDLRDRMVAGVVAQVPDVVLNGAPSGPGRLPGNAHLSFPGCPGDTLLMLLDAEGIAVSTASACAAGVPEPSHVLVAMGVDPALATSSVRLSLGRSSRVEDVDALLGVLPGVVARARAAGDIHARPANGRAVPAQPVPAQAVPAGR